MKRRNLLAKAGLTTTILAGCLKNETGENRETTDGRGNSTDESGNDSDKDGKNEVTYEQCASSSYVTIASLPAPAEVEILTAILDGEYKTSQNLVLPQAYNIQSTYFTRYNDKNNKIYYIVGAEKDGHLNRLRVKETFPETDPVRLSNKTTDDLTFDIRLQYANVVPLHDDRAKTIIENKGQVLVEETVEVAPPQNPMVAETDHQFPTDAEEDHITTLALGGDEKYRYGSYQAEVSVNELDITESMTWVMWEEYDSPGVIELNSRVGLSHHHGHLSEIGTLGDCEWNDNGELIEGPGVE